ncbi:MAG: DUF4292 domain-containing protein [Prevotella sp.]|nr:DUF4292 domain-containing protein [Prevotella sp.]
MKKILLAAVVVLVVASCGTKKTAVTGPAGPVTETVETNTEQQRINYLRKVYDNAVYTKNIVSSIDFTINTGSKNISVGGSIHMRKDDVMRIQLTALGLMEVGRLEFTKDYVMIVDRIHKEYIKADYNKVDFMKRNGLNFYTLQALFWNMLFVPGEANMTDRLLEKFTVDLATKGTMVPLSLKNGNMDYVWQTESKTGLIRQTDVTYSDKANGTTKLTCKYDNFKSLGTKQYPHLLTLNGQSVISKQPRNVTITIKMDGAKMSSDWETRTTLSSKYKEVSADEVLEKIMNM